MSEQEDSEQQHDQTLHSISTKRRKTSRTVEEEPASTYSTPSGSVSVDQVFSMFKDYLENKMTKNSKEFETKSKTDKQVAQMKYKGNQHQFEHNAKIEALLEKAKMENSANNKNVDSLLDEAKALIKKRQKLIRLADKSKDGWKVVDEYVSDELASDSEDEKKIRRAKQSAAQKSRSVKRTWENRPRTPQTNYTSQADKQLFRGNPRHQLDNSRCYRCNQFGHWAKDCRHTYSSTYGASKFTYPARDNRGSTTPK